MDIQEIVNKWLIDKGFDGLFSDGSGDSCACEVGDLMPCGEPANCEAGYKVPCDCGDHRFHIQKEKPKAKKG